MSGESWFVIFHRLSLVQQHPILFWFIALEILTVISIPIVMLIFRSYPDKGFPLSKIVTLTLIAYFSWLGSSLKFFLFTRETIFLLTFFIATCSFILFIKTRSEIVKFIKNKWRLLLFEEILFWAFFSVFLYIRYQNPDLWHPYMGGEKPMDFAFLNAVIRNKTFPPYDPWFAGGFINYYYFGQLIIGTFIKLTGIIPSAAYNLSLAYLFAQCALGAFSIVFYLNRSIFSGFLGSLFVVGIGNLAQIPLIIKSFSSTLPINAWYWTATRVMPNYEINEFPFFSFLYADLHSHLIALPIAITVIAISIPLLKEKVISNINCIFRLVFISLFLGILRSANTWDYPSYLLFYAFLVLLFFFNRYNLKFKLLFKFVISIFIIVFLSNLSILPFLSHYQTGPLGIEIYQGQLTRVTDYILIHGFFLYILLTFFISTIELKFFSKLKRILPVLFFTIVIFILFYLKLWFFLFLSFYFFTGLIALISLKNNNEEKRGRMVMIVFSLFAIFFTVIPDLIDFKLGLGRMNTVFKFYFQAWLFFALSSAGSIPFIMHKLRKIPPIFRYIWILVFIILFMASLTYPPGATYAKIKDRISKDTPASIDGMLYMKYSNYFDQGHKFTLNWDYQAINWILDNIQDTPVILEGNAPVYRWGSRVSIYTGLPTIIGWDWHEIAHRSNIPGSVINNRVADVKTMYDTNNIEVFTNLVKKYNIRYIYIGELEKAYYNPAGLSKFSQLTGNLLSIVYQNPGVTIYKISDI